MAKNTAIAGSDVQIFIGGTTIAAATTCSISMSADATDISHKDLGGWKASQITGRSWEATTSNLYVNDAVGKSFSDLFTAYSNGTELTFSCGLTQNAGSVDSDRVTEVPAGGWTNSTGLLYGKCVITSLSLNGDNSGTASYDCTFTGVGALSSTAPSAS